MHNILILTPYLPYPPVKRFDEILRRNYRSAPVRLIRIMAPDESMV
jgi:hypothetical protein